MLGCMNDDYVSRRNKNTKKNNTLSRVGCITRLYLSYSYLPSICLFCVLVCFAYLFAWVPLAPCLRGGARGRGGGVVVLSAGPVVPRALEHARALVDGAGVGSDNSCADALRVVPHV